MPSRRFLLRLVVVLAVLAIAGLTALGFMPGTAAVRVASSGGALGVSADRRGVVWPRDCVTLAWQSSAVTNLTLDGAPVTPVGTRVVCDAARRLPIVTGVFPDGRERVVSPELTRVRVSPIACLALLAVELLLIDLATSAPRRLATWARLSIFVVPLLVTGGLRLHQAWTTPDVLDWDETYYTSIAATAAAGRGLYPAVVGYDPMPMMGGHGYLVYTYALGVKLWGPSVFALRAISLVASLAGLAGMWALVRFWYGSGAAWMSAALTSTLALFVMSNSARMDAWTFAVVVWGLFAVALALEPGARPGRHLTAGLVFGFGLQAHLDTVCTAVACGGLHVGNWIGELRRSRSLVVPRQLLLYTAGWLVGLLVFVAANVLPDPTAFYRTTVVVRVDATTAYSAGTSSLFASFLNPAILLAKEGVRYGQLLRAVPPAEVLLIAAALVAAIIRRHAADRYVLTLVPLVLVAASVVLNNAHPVYFIHILPVLAVPLAPLFTHGLRGSGKVTLAEVGAGPLVGFAVAISVLCALNNARTFKPAHVRAAEDPAAVALVARVRASVDRGCRVAGDGGLFVRYFADYPYFVSWRPTEVYEAMRYFALTDETAYWELKQPEAVFAATLLTPALAAYVAQHGLAAVGPGIWIRPGGCAGQRSS